jgi:glycosyltransferase involved in cell wall biosynthesis
MVMRIAQVSATYPPYWSGTGAVCHYSSRELARQGHEVHVFTTLYPESKPEEEMEGVKVHRLKPLFQIGNAPLLLELLGLKGFDLLHLHYPFIFGSEMISFVSQIRKMPYVITYHNDLIGRGLRHWIFSAYSCLTIRYGLYPAVRCLTVSNDHALSSRLESTFLKRNFTLIEVPNGVDISQFKYIPEGASKVREKIRVAQNDLLFLFVAALDRAHHFKGLDILLQSIANLKFNNFRLLIIGDGDLKPEFETLSNRLGLEERVSFTGAICNKDLAAYYSAADVTILPSMPPESFGLVLIESMACGTPVIASNLPGLRTVVEQGVDGYLVPAGDASALTDALHLVAGMTAEARRAMGLEGRRKVVLRYDWHLIGEKLEAIYQDVLGSKM